jgi:hypothetical protein
LNSVETLYFVLGHWELFPGYWWNVLNEPNHGPITFWVKLFVIARLNLTEPANSFFLGGWVRVFSQFWFEVISKITAHHGV